MVIIFVGKRTSEVPSGLTIMQAMEYLGYKFLRGCGCRGGFCGACATVYRIFGDHSLNTALACQKPVEEGMCLEIVPYTPAEKKTYDIRELRPSHTILIEHYPEEKPEALEHLNFAIEEFREMKMQPYLEQALKKREVLGI